MRKLYSTITTLTLLLLVYIIYTGRVGALTLVSALAVSSLITLYINKHLQFKGLPSINLRILIDSTKFLYLFIITEFKEHIELSKIILSREIKLNPGLIDIPIELSSETGSSLVALTITNTPGTIAVDVDLERKMMTVHWINIKTTDVLKAKQIILGEFELLARAMFG
ncbi:MAG: Na+/H+ antiporter subunit E [Desulfurococcaceae archaeon]